MHRPHCCLQVGIVKIHTNLKRRPGKVAWVAHLPKSHRLARWIVRLVATPIRLSTNFFSPFRGDGEAVAAEWRKEGYWEGLL